MRTEQWLFLSALSVGAVLFISLTGEAQRRAPTRAECMQACAEARDRCCASTPRGQACRIGCADVGHYCELECPAEGPSPH